MVINVVSNIGWEACSARAEVSLWNTTSEESSGVGGLGAGEDAGKNFVNGAHAFEAEAGLDVALGRRRGEATLGFDWDVWSFTIAISNLIIIVAYNITIVSNL